jgi:hypothetical protein
MRLSRRRPIRSASHLGPLDPRGVESWTGIHPILLAQYELDQIEPGPENLVARGVGLTTILAIGIDLPQQVLPLSTTPKGWT